jgi:hypothetical protein
MVQEFILGEGRLSWFRDERITGRYGLVYLFSGSDGHHGSIVLQRPPLEVQDSGSLVAVVLANRQCQHIGDHFRGVKPSMPAIGERILLGTGKLLFEDETDDGDMYHKVGLMPEDGRKTDWLDIHAIYRVIDQTVRLIYTPEEK